MEDVQIPEKMENSSLGCRKEAWMFRNGRTFSCIKDFSGDEIKEADSHSSTTLSL